MIKTLRDVFDANIVRVPEEKIEPLDVIASRNGKAMRRGRLAPILSGSVAFDPDALTPETSTMANLSGKRSRTVDLDLGFDVLGSFLQGFGIPSAGIETHLKGAKEVAFSFSDVKRTKIDLNVLGNLLSGRSVASNPATAIFFGDDAYDLLVIDSVITSSDFQISVVESSTQDFAIDVPAVSEYVAKASAGVEVASSSSRDLTFKGSKNLVFAFSSVRFYLDERRQITSMPPELRVVLTKGILPGGGSSMQYSPDRVLIGDEPAMLEL